MLATIKCINHDIYKLAALYLLLLVRSYDRWGPRQSFDIRKGWRATSLFVEGESLELKLRDHGRERRTVLGNLALDYKRPRLTYANHVEHRLQNSPFFPQNQ